MDKVILFTQHTVLLGVLRRQSTKGYWHILKHSLLKASRERIVHAHQLQSSSPSSWTHTVTLDELQLTHDKNVELKTSASLEKKVSWDRRKGIHEY